MDIKVGLAPIAIGVYYDKFYRDRIYVANLEIIPSPYMMVIITQS